MLTRKTFLGLVFKSKNDMVDLRSYSSGKSILVRASLTHGNIMGKPKFYYNGHIAEVAEDKSVWK